MSHGSHVDHEALIAAVRGLESELERPTTIVADLQGPKLRVGRFRGGKAELEKGSIFVFDLDDKRISAIINLWGFALVTPMGLWAAYHFDFATVALPIWGLLVFYGMAASVWTVWLWMTGLKTVPASQAGVFTVMLPISAAAIGVLFMGERLTDMQVLAFGIALLGLVLATLPGRQRH